MPCLGQIGEVVDKRSRTIGVAADFAFCPFVVAELDGIAAALFVGDAELDSFVVKGEGEGGPAEHIVGEGERDVAVVVFGTLPLSAYGA